VVVNGDGLTSRDFCYVENAVQANLLAATSTLNGEHNVCNVAYSDRTTLNELFDHLTRVLSNEGITYTKKPRYADFRDGDVRHSHADISKANQLFGYQPMHEIGRAHVCSPVTFRTRMPSAA